MQPKRFANKRKKYHCPLSLLHPVTVTYSKLTQKKGSSNNNSNKMPTWLPQLRACGQLVSMVTDLITNKVIFNWITAKVDGKTFSSYHAHKHTHTHLHSACSGLKTDRFSVWNSVKNAHRREPRAGLECCCCWMKELALDTIESNTVVRIPNNIPITERANICCKCL